MRFVPEDRLSSLAGEPEPTAKPSSSPSGNGRGGQYPFLLVTPYLNDRGQDHRVRPEPDAKGRTVYVLKECPFNPSHGDPDSCVMQWPNGMLNFKCLHNSCRDKTWQDFREKIGPPERKHYDPATLTRAAHQRDGTTGKKEEVPKFHFVGLKTFLAGDYRAQFLVPRILVRDQPAVIGGTFKALKTTVAIDLAVSMATMTPFLGTFPVTVRSRVAIVSGESGRGTIHETILRILKARGIDPADLDDEWLKLDFRLPTFSDMDVMTAFADQLAAMETDVGIIDPTYLSLGDADPKNVFEMGRVLRNVSDAFLSRKITPILVHHANRMLPVGDVMGLEHLSHAGLAEYSRQWLLLNRRERYQGDGVNDLWMSVGGSAGHGGLWSLHVEEGIADENFSGRRWDVTVESASTVIKSDGLRKSIEKQKRKAQQDREDDQAVMIALDRLDPGVKGASRGAVLAACGLPKERFRTAVVRLMHERVIIDVPVETIRGNGAKVVGQGIKRDQ